MLTRELMIRNYVDAYNRFDVENMTKDFAENFLFQDIQNGRTTMRLEGIEAFREQAESGKRYFTEREQKILGFLHQEQSTEVEIHYSATLMTDLPNGIKRGEPFSFLGKSVFVFQGGRISALTDMS